MSDLQPPWNVLATDQLEIEYEWEGWHLTCSWPQRGRRHEVVIIIGVSWLGTGKRIVVAPTRVNLYSGSAMDGIARLMRKVEPGPDPKQVDALLQEVRANLLDWYKQGRRTERPDPATAEESSGWVLYPIWPYPGITGVSAAPDAFKSFLAEALALQARSGQMVLTRNTKVLRPFRILYLDWESGPGRFAARLGALCRGAGLEVKPWLDYQHLTIPLADAAPTLAEDIIRFEIDAVIIDSMSAGIGSALKEDEAVNAFFDAVRLLDRPALVLAHKSAENIRKRATRFFGSIMSEVRLRMAWNAERVDGAVVWECFKDNDTNMKGKKLAWELDFQSSGEDETLKLEAVVVKGVKPTAVDLREEPGRPSVAWMRIAESIKDDGPGTSDELAYRLGEQPNAVRANLSRHKDVFVKLSDGLRWGLISPESLEDNVATKSAT